MEKNAGKNDFSGFGGERDSGGQTATLFETKTAIFNSPLAKSELALHRIAQTGAVGEVEAGHVGKPSAGSDSGDGHSDCVKSRKVAINVIQ